MYTIADISIWPWVHALHTNYGDALMVIVKYNFNMFNMLYLIICSFKFRTYSIIVKTFHVCMLGFTDVWLEMLRNYLFKSPPFYLKNKKYVPYAYY